MAIYDIDGLSLTSAYDVGGNTLASVYDIDGNNIFNGSPETEDGYRTDRVLAWEQKFDGEYGTPPDESIWTHELGYQRNNELQFYQGGNANTYCDGEGHLVIEARREERDGYTWTSGSIISNDGFEFGYGRLEAKIKLPNTLGGFPAFWLLGAGRHLVYSETPFEDGSYRQRLGVKWPLSPEIDVVEQFYGNPQTVSSIHYSLEEDGDAISTQVGTYDIEENPTWHVYGMEWTADNMIFYVDDNVVGYSKLPQTVEMLNRPLFMQLNLAVGSKGGQPSNDLNSMQMMVDWIRYYLPKGITKKYNVEKLTIDTENVTLAVGETAIVFADFTPSTCWNKTLKWSTDNEEVATCYGGKIWAIGSGTATIMATAHNGVIATCNVTVN